MNLATSFPFHDSHAGWQKTGNQTSVRFNTYLALFRIWNCALCAQYISSRTTKVKDFQAQQTYLLQNLPVLAQHRLLSGIIVPNVKPHYHKSISFSLVSILWRIDPLLGNDWVNAFPREPTRATTGCLLLRNGTVNTLKIIRAKNDGVFREVRPEAI
jgi:hypothetical protein